MKYKLINRTTGVETLCDKVTIDGFDYYVSDELPKLNDVVITAVGNIHYIKDGSKDFIEYVSKLGKKVIATNNPNIGVPKVMDEVETLAREFATKTVNPLNPAGTITCLLSQNGFEKGYNKSQATHPFSEEDMIEFGEMVAWNMVDKTITESFVKGISKELLQLWKEQRPKIVYYE